MISSSKFNEFILCDKLKVEVPPGFSFTARCSTIVWIHPHTIFGHGWFSCDKCQDQQERSVQRRAVVCPFLCREMTGLCANNAKTSSTRPPPTHKFPWTTSRSCLITPAFDLRLATIWEKENSWSPL